MTEVQNCRKEYLEKEQTLALAEEQVKELQETIEQRIQEQAEKKIGNQKKQQEKEFHSRLQEMKKSFRAKETRLESLTLGGMLYSVLVTVCMAVQSKRFISDFGAFFDKTGTFLHWLYENSLEAAKWTSQIANKVPPGGFSAFLHSLIQGIVFLLLYVGTMVLIGGAIYRLIKYYRAKLADKISVWVFLISLVMAIFCGSVIPWNLMVFLLGTQVVYVGIRAYVESCRRNRGYY